jgi:glutathione S-transferase
MPILLYDLVGKDTARPFSPHCWKVAFALAHKGLDFESVPTAFTEVPLI